MRAIMHSASISGEGSINIQEHARMHKPPPLATDEREKATSEP